MLKIRKSKTEKGITLIALIITIVVLLILAAVAIAAIQNENILSHANNAAVKYNGSVQNEQDILGGYLNFLDNQGSSLIATEWIQTGTTVTNGIVTLKVGDTITNYDESKKEDGTTISGLTNVEWKVLGAENGKILLFSTDDLDNGYKLKGADGYYNGVSELNILCADYGYGKFAESARTITVEDINRITGYQPIATGNGKIFGQYEPYQYNNQVTYTLKKDADGTVTGIVWTSDADSFSTSSFMKIMAPDGKRMMSDEEWEAITNKTGLTKVDSVTFTSNYYWYYPDTLTTNNTGTLKGIAPDSAAYLMLFTDPMDSTKEASYWLGNEFTLPGEGQVNFGLRKVDDYKVDNYVLWYSSTGANNGQHGVRAVVTLKADVKIKSNGTNSWELNY